LTNSDINQNEPLFYYTISSPDDAEVIATLLRDNRCVTYDHLTDELGALVDVGSNISVVDEVRSSISNSNQEFIVATDRSGKTVGLLACQHIESVPPVYDPQRAILCLHELHICNGSPEIVSAGLLDAAVRWSAQKTDKPILIVSISWQYDAGRRIFLERYSQVSAQRTDTNYKEVYFHQNAPAKPRGAGRWYFAQHIELSSTKQSEHTVRIRRAEVEDIPQMVRLSEKKRVAGSKVQPIFWRQGANANALQEGHFTNLLSQSSTVALVHEAGCGSISGFVIGLSRNHLPLIDSAIHFKNGLHIDDFALDDDDDWPTVGRDLLGSVCAAHGEQCHENFVVNVISGDHETKKCQFLQTIGMRHLYTWVVLPGGVNSLEE
jgi:hypothetical protein